MSRTPRAAACSRSSPHSRAKRTWSSTAPSPAKRSQSPIQPAWRSRKASASARETRARGRASRPAQPAKADGLAYGDPCSSGGPRGRTCHHRWPASASQSTNSSASGPSFPPGNEVTWRRTPLARRPRIAEPREGVAADGIGKEYAEHDRHNPAQDAAADPDRQRLSDGRRRAGIPPSARSASRSSSRRTWSATATSSCAPCCGTGHPGRRGWTETPMSQISPDRWRGSSVGTELGLHQLVVEAWVDPFSSWRHEVDPQALGRPDRPGERARRGRGPDRGRGAAS